MIKLGFITKTIYPPLTKSPILVKLPTKVKLIKSTSGLSKSLKVNSKGLRNQPKSRITKPQNIKSLSNLAFTKTFSRNTLLLPFLLGKKFLVHNGKTFLKVLVSENIVGHKLGEFSQTRRRYYYKKGKKIKNSGNKKK